ncbi:MAG: MFS transporter [Leucobacter sp.]
MRRGFLIAALVCGGLGIGVSEFIVMGLLPQIAEDLVGGLYASHPESALAATGGLASAYALGVVVGMFITPLVLRRVSERTAILVCAGGMLLWTVLLVFAPTLPIAIALRFLASLTHATYIGVGALATAHMLGSNRYGRGSAVMHGGIAGANLLAVPALTALGAEGDWRLIVAGCALLFAVPFVAFVCIAPPETAGYVAGTSGGRVFGHRLVVIAIGVILLAGGGFAVITYVAPVTEWAQGGGGWLTAALAMLAFGIGMNAGNFGAGWLADRAAVATFWSSAAIGIAGALLLLVPGIGSLGTGIAILLVGVMVGAGGPTSQVLYLGELRNYPRLASAMPSGTGNMGSFVGSVVGAGLLAGVGPALVPIGALGLIGAGLVFFALRMRARSGAAGS